MLQVQMVRLLGGRDVVLPHLDDHRAAGFDGKADAAGDLDTDRRVTFLDELVGEQLLAP